MDQLQMDGKKAGLVDWKQLRHELSNGLSLMNTAFPVLFKRGPDLKEAEELFELGLNKVKSSIKVLDRALAGPTDDSNEARPDLSGCLPDLIQIDDDRSMRLAWAIEARRENKVLLSFGSKPNVELLRALGVKPSTEFYLDLQLADGKSGFDVASDLYAAGYTNLYISTGYEGSEVEARAPGFLKGRIRGKDFPH